MIVWTSRAWFAYCSNMFRRTATFLGLATALALGAVLAHAQKTTTVQKTAVNVGVLAYLGPDEAASAWEPTLAQLNAALPA